MNAYQKAKEFIKSATNEKTLYEDIRNILSKNMEKDYPEDWEIKELQRMADARYEELKNSIRYIVESNEEEDGKRLFEVIVPRTIPKETVMQKFEMASKYADPGWEDDWKENKSEYDKNAEQMLGRYENGIFRFNYYIEEICGWKIVEINSNFKYVW